MDRLLLVIFFILLIYLIHSGRLTTGVDPPRKDNSGHVKPEHLL